MRPWDFHEANTDITDEMSPTVCVPPLPGRDSYQLKLPGHTGPINTGRSFI